MKAASVFASLERPEGYGAIIWGGLIAGALDLTAAVVINGLSGGNPTAVLQLIASGLLGADSFKGGLTSAVIGALLHFLIAFAAAAVYYEVSRRRKFLVQRAIVCGLIYGVAVLFFMDLIVLPLSAFPFTISYSLDVLIPRLITHMVFVGLPISLTVRRYSI